MDAAEFRHVVLGLFFRKYISDAFEAKHSELDTEKKKGADPEDPDEYRAANIFWVPKEARWTHLKAKAPQPTIGKLVDEAMSAMALRSGLRRERAWLDRVHHLGKFTVTNPKQCVPYDSLILQCAAYRAIARAGELMGIPLYDHVIMSRVGFVSLKEKGLL
jgi:hypothetical protein